VCTSYVSLPLLRISDGRAALLEAEQSAHANTRDLWDAITIKAPAQRHFGGHLGLEPNKIFALDEAEPDFLMEFKNKLRLRRYVEFDTVCIF